MGELIKNIGDIKIKGEEFVIEINHRTTVGGERSIHIQNDNGRFCVSESDYSKFVMTMIAAKDKLLKSKEG